MSALYQHGEFGGNQTAQHIAGTKKFKLTAIVHIAFTAAKLYLQGDLK